MKYIEDEEGAADGERRGEIVHPRSSFALSDAPHRIGPQPNCINYALVQAKLNFVFQVKVLGYFKH